MTEKKSKKTEEFLLKIKEAEQKAGEVISQSKNSAELENSRVKTLGRNGFVNEILKSLAGLSQEERKVIGPKAQGLKSKITDLIENKKEKIDSISAQIILQQYLERQNVQ